MKLPKMNGLEVIGTIGAGESGRVFAAQDDDGHLVAVKVFEGMAINRSLLSKMTERLEVGGWPEGLVKVDSADFEGRPACWILENFAEAEGEGEDAKWMARTLQHKMDEYPGENSWPLVKEIGRAMGEMHARRVPHGNLKPGNVFFDESGVVKLADWTLGNMPGISHFDFTDALLYQAPEQLVDPSGYLNEAGYKWDVFAFGVLAFRLLTGQFPRCSETFLSVAPEVGETRKDGIQADAAKVAKGLLQHPEVKWPLEAQNDLEKGYREWIDRCLKLEAEDRPSSMVEVMSGLEAVESMVAWEQVRETLLDQRRKAERSGRRVTFYAGMATAACLVLGGLWYLTQTQLGQERSERSREKAALDSKARIATDDKKAAVEAKDEAEQLMEYERSLGLARLESSRLIGDRLFEWALEKGHRNLPPIDGREVRLKRLERFFDDFLTRTSGIDSLGEERARVRLQLAEVALASGDAEVAEERLDEAIGGWTAAVIDADMKLRLGRNALLLALLKKEKGDELAGEAFEAARTALAEVPEDDVDSDRLGQLRAILDFHEAKLLSKSGDDGKALEQLMSATRTLNELSDKRPDIAVLRSELAACYLSSATILEGMGSLGDAREVRSLAAAEMVKLLKESPNDIELRLDLAGCYGAMAEAAVLAGDVGNAEKLSTETMGLLNSVLQSRPDSTVAIARKAAQLGLKAGILRDQGNAVEAIAAFDEGINILERLSAGGDPLVDYRLALLWWQKGRMFGFDGEKAKELTYLGKARDALMDLEAEGDGSGLSSEELQRSSAYLLGDLAHALEVSGKMDDAKAIYREAVVLWERLAKSRPQSEEYREGLDWIRQRANEV
ncbi:protein kinase domain-containing protein [Luteolibacter sp. AS25]|uniref:protein kinase domain-containing protein n=1 Tax=Luteolibacter sp. AS25 TaxID=3135776 RepID=UPI00398B87E5